MPPPRGQVDPVRWSRPNETQDSDQSNDAVRRRQRSKPTGSPHPAEARSRPSGRTASSSWATRGRQSVGRARASVRQIRRDARRPERVAARRRRQTRRRRTALDHRQHHAPRQRPTAQAARPVDALKQRRLRVLNPAGDPIRIHGGLGPVMGRHVVPLAALLVQPQPSARPLQEIVLTPHPHDRAHPGEAVHHHAQQRTVPQPYQRPRVDPIEQRPRLGRRQHRRRPFGHHVLRAPHRRGRIHRQHLVNDQPVAQHPDGGQMPAPTRDACGYRPPRAAARSRAGPGPEPHTTSGTAPRPAHTPPASARWRSRPRRTPGSTATGPASTITAGSAMAAADPVRATGGR